MAPWSFVRTQFSNFGAMNQGYNRASGRVSQRAHRGQGHAWNIEGLRCIQLAMARLLSHTFSQELASTHRQLAAEPSRD
jgi:hypothetical protein